MFGIFENPYILPVPTSGDEIDFDSDDLFPGLNNLQK